MVANHFLHDTRVYKQARSLIEWGCEVYVVAMANSSLPLVEEIDGIHVHRVNMRHGDVVRLGGIILFWWSRPILRRLVGSPRPDESQQRVDDAQPPANESQQMLRRMYRRWSARVRGSRWRTQTGGPTLWFVAKIIIRVGKIIIRVIDGVRRRITRVLRTIKNRIKRLAPSSLRLVAMNLQFARHTMHMQPDVVQSHDLNALLGGALVKRLTGAPLVYDSHELFLKRNIGDKSRARDNLLWAPIERFCIGKCDAVLSVAEGICEYLAKQYDIPKPHLIRNVQPFEPPGERTTILADELGIPRDRRIVIYPGAITINRGLEVMIDSASHLNDAAYVIMGYARNPQYLDSLKQRAEKLSVMGSSVFFREAVPIEDVIRYVGSADLGIVPTQNVCLSYFFESSNKIFHCVMAGVPVAMSDHREKRLLVEEYGIGVLFNETDPAQIARVVNQALDDREAYAQMRRNCLEAARVLNWEHEERTLRQIFADLLGDRAAPIPQISIEPMCATQTQPSGQPHYVTTK